VPVDIALRAETRGSLAVYPVPRARELGIDAFVTDRFGGVSQPPYDTLNLGDHVGDEPQDVIENRRRVTSAIGDNATLTIVRQVHGTRVLEASRATASSEADALYSEAADTALAVLVADCIPILLVDEDSTRFAVVHAGWRGLHEGVVVAALAHFEDARHVAAFLGPSISQEGYQVGPEVATLFADVPGAVAGDGDDRFRLDLREVATAQLLGHGVRDGHVLRSQQVTDGGEMFFSDRAQRPCGRFALVARRAS